MPKVQEKGQVTLETALRELVGIQPGDDIEEMVLRPGQPAPAAGIFVVPRRKGMGRFRGLLASGESTDATVDQLRGH